MKEVFGDVWKYPADIICIPTNGDVDRFGSNVMGKGIALEAKKRSPGIEKTIGWLLKVEEGNFLFQIGDPNSPGQHYCTFPTKNHWKSRSSLELIRHSARELRDFAKMYPDKIFVLPRPGCGNGQLDWKDVKPLLLDLPDNVHVITNEKE